MILIASVMLDSYSSTTNCLAINGTSSNVIPYVPRIEQSSRSLLRSRVLGKNAQRKNYSSVHIRRTLKFVIACPVLVAGLELNGEFIGPIVPAVPAKLKFAAS